MIAKNDFLLEIGTEELPPKALHHLSQALGDNMQKLLQDATLEHGAIKLFATPRRLAVLIEKLAAKQKERLLEQRGPQISVAFMPDGTPTVACLGFAKAHGVRVEDLERASDQRGTCVMVKKMQLGETVHNLLPKIANQALKNLPMLRLMRWGNAETVFVRPVHWVVMLYGDEVIKGEVLGVAAGGETYGHRFHHPEAIKIGKADEYENKLQTQGFVIADFKKRRDLIAKRAVECSAAVGQVVLDEALLEENTSLTEWPVALVGKFDERFLRLPAEILMLALQKQQRCFTVVGKEEAKEKLLPLFVAISNIESKKSERVIKGNENVILARLADAEFFYTSDIQFSLESYFDKLQKTVFHGGLGNVYDKTVRLGEAASYIASLINADVAATQRAALLSKSDLMTTMVGEFPELQGIAGSYYALYEGESKLVAEAIREQYLPRFANDTLPQSLEGCALAIADRLENIVGVFSLGQIPTGEGDPFGLRRAVFGILRIVLEKGLDLDLQDLARRTLRQYLTQLEKFNELLMKNYQVSSKDQEKTLEETADVVIDMVTDFIFERQRSWYLEKGVSAHSFDAVRMREPRITRPLDFDKRLQAVEYFKKLEEAASLSAAHKRVKNILASARQPEKLAGLELNQKLLEEGAEADLAAKVLKMDDVIKKLCAESKYKEALSEIATLKASVDYFFDNVMVMVDSKKIRNNRLALLKKLQNLFYAVADISYLH